MRGKILAFATLVGAGLFMSGTPVYATGVTAPGQETTTVVKVISSPDDTVGSGPWARDTFTRTTHVSTQEKGKVTVRIQDSGTFTTTGGLKGDLEGFATWKIEGGTQKDKGDVQILAKYDRSNVATKDSFTGDWWKKFVTGGEVTSFVWKWKYSACEGVQVRVESSESGVSGDRPGTKPCPTKKPLPTKSVNTSPSASTSASASTSTSSSASSSASPSVSQSPGVPAGVVGGGPSLPVTGPSGWVLGAVAVFLVALGAVSLIATKRRKAKFVA